MQYHFMLMYDDGTKSWNVDHETMINVMTDGTVYDPNTYPGWFWPEDGSPEQELDWQLFCTLQSTLAHIPDTQEA